MTANSKVQQIKAGYLPGLSDDEVQWHVLPFERNGMRLDVSVPMLTGEQVQALVDFLRATIPKLREDRGLHATLGQQLDLCSSYLALMQVRTICGTTCTLYLAHHS